MKVYAKEVFQKLLIRWGFFKNQLLVAADLWWSKNTKKSVKAPGVHHDHHPTRGSEVAKMCHDMVRIQATQGTECCRSLLLYLPIVYKCMIFP